MIFPRVEYENARRLEVSDIARHHGQTMRLSSCGNPAIALTYRIGNVQRSASDRDCRVHRQHTTGKAGFDDMVEPVP